MKFSKKVLEWYKVNKRELPWRLTNDPYKIWISEIILQQTRVEQGTAYYERFIHRFPTLKSLANASEEEVLNVWQGLGYYSRARNMHSSAKRIHNELGSIFPDRYSEIIKLKGIGEYTAAAIASIAFNRAYAVVDGNVVRVISRVFGIKEAADTSSGKKKVQEKMNELLPSNDAGTFNQAIMEFGALQCTPRTPDCKQCIFIANCFANLNGLVDSLPAKSRKVKTRTRYLYYLVYVANMKNDIFNWIVKREKEDIWKGLYDFPHYDFTSLHTIKDIKKRIFEDIPLAKNSIITVSHEYKHVLSHQVLKVRFFIIELAAIEADKNISWLENKRCLKIKTMDINNYPLPRLIEKFVSENSMFSKNSK
ncbi:MAG: A/G-specific adenine glycosylase [Bacteroidales bacterium]|nr:A/G-specific adenine glycosylase [Bacteroidales bacterium]MCF8402672.1 A/G-specific adenine glycosylase [Bacteroidales bacterium]